LRQLSLTSIPRDKIFIFGDGNALVVFVKEEDIKTFTIKEVDDPRKLNKICGRRILVRIWRRPI
jgi:hypothetical protein